MPGTGITPPFGRPGVGTALVAQRRNVSRNGALDYFPAGGVIDGTLTRDVNNAANGYAGTALEPGLVVGMVSATGKYANSFFGRTNGALTSTATTVTFNNAYIAQEIARRIGASGTFNLTGPAVAGGTVRTMTATYSALNTTAGTATISALGVNEVQTLNFGNTPAGTFSLTFFDYQGNLQNTGPITYSSTVATLISNIQTAVNLVIPQVGGTNQIVSGGSAVTAITLTYSGVNYAGNPQTLVTVAGELSTTGTITASRTTAGASGAFVSGSFVQPTDGSGSPLTVIPDGYGLVIPDNPNDNSSYDIDFPMIPVAGSLDVEQIIDYPADAALKTWLKQQLSTATGGKWIFSDTFTQGT